MSINIDCSIELITIPEIQSAIENGVGFGNGIQKVRPDTYILMLSAQLFWAGNLKIIPLIIIRASNKYLFVEILIISLVDSLFAYYTYLLKDNKNIHDFAPFRPVLTCYKCIIYKCFEKSEIKEKRFV